MKAFLTLIFVTLLAQPVISQVDKGSFLVGGSLGFSNSKTTETFGTNPPTPSPEFKSVSLNLAPNISYFVIKGLALGITPSYSYTNEKETNGSYQEKTHTFSIGPMARYYYMLNKWAIFSHVSYNFGWETLKGFTFNQFTGTNQYATQKSTTGNFKGGIGATYFLNNKVGIEGLVFYQQNNVSQPGLDSNSPSINFNIGLQVFLSKKPVN